MVRAKIEKNTLFGRALVRFREKIEKNTVFEGAWQKIKTLFVAIRLWLWLGQK